MGGGVFPLPQKPLKGRGAGQGFQPSKLPWGPLSSHSPDRASLLQVSGLATGPNNQITKPVQVFWTTSLPEAETMVTRPYPSWSSLMKGEVPSSCTTMQTYTPLMSVLRKVFVFLYYRDYKHMRMPYRLSLLYLLIYLI